MDLAATSIAGSKSVIERGRSARLGYSDRVSLDRSCLDGVCPRRLWPAFRLGPLSPIGHLGPDDGTCADDRGDHWTRLAGRRGDVETQPAVLEGELHVQEGTAARLEIGEFDRCPIEGRGQPESHPVREVLSLRVFTQRCPCRRRSAADRASENRRPRASDASSGWPSLEAG